MDDFELTRNVRSISSTQNMPIIINSSRMAEKHLIIAKSLGTNIFFGKLNKEDGLLKNSLNILNSGSNLFQINMINCSFRLQGL